MNAAAERVQGVVSGLARSGAQGFHPSYVAREVEQPVRNVVPILKELAERGILEETFELVCPTCGRTVAHYKLGEDLPIGQIVECTESISDPPFIPSDRDFIVTYSPTASYLSKVLRDETVPDAKKKSSLITGWTKIGSLLSLQRRSTL